jgi:hypothetical protein
MNQLLLIATGAGAYYLALRSNARQSSTTNGGSSDARQRTEAGNVALYGGVEEGRVERGGFIQEVDRAPRDDDRADFAFALQIQGKGARYASMEEFEAQGKFADIERRFLFRRLLVSRVSDYDDKLPMYGVGSKDARDDLVRPMAMVEPDELARRGPIEGVPVAVY